MRVLLSMNVYCKSWKWNKVATVNYKSLNYEHVLFLLFWWFQRNQHELRISITSDVLPCFHNISTIWSIILQKKYQYSFYENFLIQFCILIICLFCTKVLIENSTMIQKKSRIKTKSIDFEIFTLTKIHWFSYLSYLDSVFCAWFEFNFMQNNPIRKVVSCSDLNSSPRLLHVHIIM